MIRVLFVCVHNSARSQMAEELLRLKTAGKVHVESAGLEPGEINPVVVEVLKTIGVDISNKQTKSVYDLLKNGSKFHYVITVCDEMNKERCPIFPGAFKYLHWNLPDPSSYQCTFQEKYEKTLVLMNEIEKKINEFLNVIASTIEISK